MPTFAFGWEHAIPFVPWTIVPYWSIDLLCAVVLFLDARADLLDHVKRLLTVQLISVACFIAWPRFGFERPDAGGVAGALFTLLMGFDKLFNQAVAAHRVAVVQGRVCEAPARHACARRAAPRFAAIGVSVLTTYQHHAIDVPTGAAVGCLALFLFPLRDAAGRLPGADASPGAAGRALARRYALGAAALALVALVCARARLGAGGRVVALALACRVDLPARRAGAFQKNALGRFPVVMRWLFAPTIAGAFVNSRLWTFRQPAPVRIDERVSIGRTPTTRDAPPRLHGAGRPDR